MKKIITQTCTLLLLITTSITANAKLFYEFSYKSGVAYENLTNPTIISDNDWTTLNIEGQLPFDFRVFNEPVDRYTITIDDGITLLGEYKWASIFPFKAEFQSRGGATSPISYKVVGTAPNRILKFEFKNAGFKNDIEYKGKSTEYINFQVWLYETSYDIEFHYGESLETFGKIALAGKDGPIVGVLGHNLFAEVGNYIVGNAAQPEIHITGPEYNMATWPYKDMVYTMHPSFNTNSVYAFTSGDIKVYPNPFKNVLNIELNGKANLVITDMTGKVVLDNNISGYTTIDTERFAKGLYFVSIITEEGTLTRKFVKS